MSKTYKLSTCGLTLNVSGPDTVEAYDAKGGSGACLAHAIAFVGRHVTTRKIQDALMPKLEALTGIARADDEKATAAARKRSKNPANVTPVKEKFKPYIERVFAANPNESDRKEIHALAQEVADAFEIDPTPSVASLNLDKADFIKADEILSRPPEDIRKVVEGLLNVVPDFEVLLDENRRIERTNLAHLLHLYKDV